MSLYLGGFKSGINFALEPESANVREDHYLGGPLFGILWYYTTLQLSLI